MVLPTPTLPGDIIAAEILARLPVKSLARFRSVSKLWNFLFSTSDFIHSHLNFTSQNPKNHSLILNTYLSDVANTSETRVITTPNYNEISILHNYNFSETEISNAPYPTQSTFSFLGSINGLVCLFSSTLQKIILWNPAIKQSKTFCLPSTQPELSVYIWGFCWDPVLDHYKVVMCSQHKNNQLFSLAYLCNSDSWRPLPNFSFPASNTNSWTPVAIVKGVPFWTFEKYSEEKHMYKSYIIKFEAGSHEFSLLSEFDYTAEEDFFLFSLKDSLVALIYSGDASNTSVDVYCLDEGCSVWRKIYNVGPVTSHVNILSHCFNYGSEIVFGTIWGLLCYDPKTNKIKHFGHKKGCLVNCYSYKASLVSVEGMEPLHLPKPSSGNNKGTNSEGRGKGRDRRNESEDQQTTKSCCIPWL